MFRLFAGLELNQDLLLAFANAYGSLGGSASRQMLLPGNAVARQMESFSEWAKQIRRMKHAVALWDLIQNQDNDGLKDCIQWEKDGRVYYEKEGVIELLTTPNDPRGLLTHLKPGDARGAGKLFIQRWVNISLRSAAEPALLWIDPVEDRSTGRVISRTTMKLRIRPNSLLGVIWLQLAQAVDGGKEYRQCTVCGGWFEKKIERGIPRKYCSKACREKAYRGRRGDEK